MSVPGLKTGKAHYEHMFSALPLKADITLRTSVQDIVRAVKAKGASLRATEQPIDTSTAAGKAFLHMSGVSAEFETNLRKERQLEGIANAIAAGRLQRA
jgi:DNA invertase Pin-like site-specific DNA recombinase